jgi:hypothetical protein
MADKNKQGGWSVADLLDWKPTEEEQKQMETGEMAYRRGYHHAIVTAFEALEVGATLQDLSNYEEAVSYWRYQETLTEMIPPPAIKGATR